jgi:hypothetical protein
MSKPPAKWNVVRVLLAAIVVAFILWLAAAIALLGWVYFVRGHFD